MNRMMRSHWMHHSRFYLSAMLGVVVWEAGFSLDRPLRLVLAGDVFFAAYLVMAGILAHRLRAVELRRRAAVEDEGALIIILLTLAAIGFSLLSLFGIINEKKSGGTLLLLLSIASVPLGWATLHTSLAFRYAHIFYVKARGKSQGDVGGLEFPGTQEPGGWDFIYHSFVIGMTSQVADVNPTTITMRKLIWAHSVVAFFYNTVLIALAVNIAVQTSSQ